MCLYYGASISCHGEFVWNAFPCVQEYESVVQESERRERVLSGLLDQARQDAVREKLLSDHTAIINCMHSAQSGHSTKEGDFTKSSEIYPFMFLAELRPPCRIAERALAES